MNVTQAITLTLTETECRDYCIQLGEALGIISMVDGGNTQTGLTVLHALAELFERHGLGIRQSQLETEVAYLRSQSAPSPPGIHIPAQG